MKKRWLSLLLVICMVLTLMPVFSTQANAVTSLPNGIYLAQQQSDTCTLASCAMMLRARAYLSAYSKWSSITEAGIRPAAWLEGVGVYNSWSYSFDGNRISVSSSQVSGFSISSLKKLLDDHPEGIVLFIKTIPHAVFVTDYDGDTFYCADPASLYSGKRIPLASSSLSKYCGNQAGILSATTGYWYVSSYSITGSDPEPDYSVTDYSAKFELMCGSKPEHKEPYGDSSTTKTYTKGNIITVVGYTYNRYGNLWYKTSSGGYIYYEYLKLDTMVQHLPPSNYVEATMKVKTPEGSGKWLKSSPYASGEYLRQYQRGETIQITHYLYNSDGNLWYETSEGDGHYVFYSFLEVQSSDAWIPSNYVESTVEIETSDVPVRDAIQYTGKIVEKLNEGDIKNVIGYVYNRWGNLWYVLGEDRVVFYDYCKNVGDADLPGDYVGQNLVVSKKTNLYDGNYWGTKTDATVSAGTKVFAVACVTNLYGNRYYEISGGKYIPGECLIPYHYTIHFDANGGSGSMPSKSVVYEEVFNLPTCSFTRDGYEFKGWNAQRKCDGKWYVSGKGWNTEEEIIANNYTKNLYSDEWEGYLNNSWANNITEANEYTLYAVWEPTSHIHSYVAKLTEPTCTERGYTTYTCSECGDSYVDSYVDALGHDWDSGKVIKAATCTEEGVRSYTCKHDASHTRTEIIPALGHDYKAVVTAPTCTEKGYTTHTCTRCGDSYVDSYVDARGHSWDSGRVTKEPTETAEGVKTFTCTVCGETRTESIPKLTHTHKLTAVAKVAATCTKDGTEAYWKCSSCGKMFSDAQGKNEISAPVVIKATGHEWDSGKVTKAATCTEAGVRTFTCKHDSSHTRTEAIPALGHDYKAVVTAPTCTEKGYTTHTCSRCGDSYVDSYVNALGHKTELRNAKAATCTTDGYTGDEICSTCGETIRNGTVIKATGHKWDSGKVTKEPTETAEGVKTFTCTVCGETKTEAIPKLTHTHNYTEVVTPPTCTEQGYTTHTCAGCGESYVDSYVDALGHKTELRNAKAATCTADGYTGDEVCSVCGVTVKQGTVIKATGHKWDSGKVTKEPTETAEGMKTFTCTVCGETRTEAIPKLTPVTPTVPNNPFVDVKQGAYYYDPVLWAVNHQPQITNGTSATTFSPDATCTRGQVVTFLWRANGCPEPKNTSNPFKDVASGAYYYKAVLWAVENGITNGTSATTFSPDAPCTRAHVVTFLWRSANKPGAGSTNPFKDVKAGLYYTDAVLWAVSKNITNGTSATTFSPDNPCTRGQIVTFLYRYMK